MGQVHSGICELGEFLSLPVVSAVQEDCQYKGLPTIPHHFLSQSTIIDYVIYDDIKGY